MLEFDKGNASLPYEFGAQTGPVRALVLKMVHPGPEFYVYTLVYEDTVTAAWKTIGVNQRDIIMFSKRVGHIELGPFLDRDWKEKEFLQKMFNFADENNGEDWIKMTITAMSLGAFKELHEAKAELEALKTRAARNLRRIGFTSKAIEDILEGKQDLDDGCCTDKC